MQFCTTNTVKQTLKKIICVQSFACLCYSLCDASLNTSIACKHLLHTVDETTLSHIRKS